MSTFDKAAFFAAAKKLPIESVDIPELGMAIYVRGMSGEERDAWEKSLIRGKGKRMEVDTTNVRARLVAKTACTEQYERLFTDADALELGQSRVDILNRLFTVAQRLSGVSDADVEELGKASALVAGSDSPTS
jgi:hypothetical protein